MRVRVIVLAALCTMLLSGGCAGEGADEVSITAKEMRFSPSALRVGAGRRTIVVHNGGALTHTFSLNALGQEVTIHPGKTRTFEVDLQPGTYRYVCRILDHEGLGMHGVLRVSAT